MPDSAELDTWHTDFALKTSDSGKSDKQGTSNHIWDPDFGARMSDSGESDKQGFDLVLQMSDSAESDIRCGGYSADTVSEVSEISEISEASVVPTVATVSPATPSTAPTPGTLRIVSFSNSGATSVTSEMMKMIVE